jgi:hypothetical protein
VTFSRSLADHIAGLDAGVTVRRGMLMVGKELATGEESTTGLYAVCKAKDGWPLRVTLFAELADWWRDDSRTVHECSIELEGDDDD